MNVLRGRPWNPYLFFIPQTLTAWLGTTGADSKPSNGSYLQITCTINGGGEITAYYPFGATLEKGYQYDVNINIGKNHLKKISGTTVESVI